MNDSHGKPVFQTLDLSKIYPVTLDDDKFYGFRFTVPKRSNGEDLIWSLIEPAGNPPGWTIVAKTEHLGYWWPDANGRTTFQFNHPEPRTAYLALGGLPPTNGRTLAIQRLAGSNLDDGQSYLIPFRFSATAPVPDRISVIFTFATTDPKSPENVSDLEKALGLERALVWGNEAVEAKPNMTPEQLEAVALVNLAQNVRKNQGFVGPQIHKSLNTDLVALIDAGLAVIHDPLSNAAKTAGLQQAMATACDQTLNLSDQISQRKTETAATVGTCQQLSEHLKEIRDANQTEKSGIPSGETGSSSPGVK